MATGKKILIAEDEKALSGALSLKLESSGYIVKVVGDGEEAIATLGAEKFDLLVLDLIMPKLDGFGVLEKIKKDKIPVTVIVASNLSQSEDEEKARALGAKDYFIKSNVGVSDIVDKIEASLK